MIYHLVFILLFILGLFAVLVEKNLIKMVIGLNIMEAAVFFWTIALSNNGGVIPIHQLGHSAARMNDPVPQALTLTGIVIGASTTAFLLTLIIELNKFTDGVSVEDLERPGD